VQAAKEVRQLKFTEPGSDRNPAQRKDVGNKQKLAINIVHERSVTLAFTIGPEETRLSTRRGRSKVNLLAGWPDLSQCPTYLESQHNTEVSFALPPALMPNPFKYFFFLVSTIWQMYISHRIVIF